jgi:hypothetical protein
MTGERIEYVPLEEAATRFHTIPRAVLAESVWLYEPDGRLSGGAAAVCGLLSLGARKRLYLLGYKYIPWASAIAESCYAWVAEHRNIADRIDRLLLPNPASLQRSYGLTRAIFLRALGVIYLIAFLSLFVQIDGLIGSKGILPVSDWLTLLQSRHPGATPFQLYLHVPTLCWHNSSDAFLHFLCAGGAVLSCVLIAGYLPVPVLILLWLFYLSLANVGQNFLSFQWDALLLEAGFLAIFFAPLQFRLRPALFLGRGRPPNPSRPSIVALFLLRWLLFRLMFLSGIVKLIAINPAWRNLTAMRYQYATQPLPTWTSWYAHLAPNRFQALSVVAVLIIEVFIPLFFFANRRLRLIACAIVVAFQLLIAATGNYGFFNLLTIVLCIPLMDDAAWARLGIRVGTTPAFVRGWRWPALIMWPLAIAIFLLSFVPFLGRLNRDGSAPDFLMDEFVAVEPFMSINSYGLFQEMSLRRPELIIEGSDDKKTWLAYEFKWKPGDIYRRPQFCTPHMPRLDWQMWFAAMDADDRHYDYWLLQFLGKLQQGSPQVLKLMGNNPFPDHPPKYLRVLQYDYSFTTFAEHRATGAWWRRVLLESATLNLKSKQAPQ